MAAKISRLERITSSVLVDTVSFTHQRRATPDASWSDAETVNTVEFAMSEIPTELINGGEKISCKAYGFSKVLQERQSEAESATERFENYLALFDQLKSGIWREAAQPRTAQLDALFVQAVATVLSCSIPVAQAKLQACDAEERKAYRDAESVQTELKALREESRSVNVEDVDLSDLLKPAQ